MKSSLTIEAVKNIKQVGSIVSSSSFLVKKILKGIEFERDVKILELGAGNGVITKEILDRMSGKSELWLYENNKNFIKALEHINDDRLILKGESATKINMLEDNYFDVVISSLPLANFKKPFKDELYRSIQQKLKSFGTFLQYQYSLSDYKDIKNNFHNCTLEFCLFNIPPAFIYKAEWIKEEKKKRPVLENIA
ncbi:methyltransferase domain-containing protein [Cytophagales bacterium RKSG123]|nr:methyltransferase domain-containing protein [Xanthovirga aplysinae]